MTRKLDKKMEKLIILSGSNYKILSILIMHKAKEMERKKEKKP
jgi:hypothetical protein